jgi:hypothetical protein
MTDNLNLISSVTSNHRNVVHGENTSGNNDPSLNLIEYTHKKASLKSVSRTSAICSGGKG